MTFLLVTECDNSLTTPTWKEEIEQFKKDLKLHHDADAQMWWKTNREQFQTA